MKHAYLHKPKAYNRDWQRLGLGVLPAYQALFEILDDYVVMQGGRRLKGKAKQGEMEREISPLLNQVQGKGKGKGKGKRSKGKQESDDGAESDLS